MINIDTFLDQKITKEKRDKIENAFVQPFKGGGSYKNFYDSLLIVQPVENRLRVGGITYNSPGYLKLRGKEKSFKDIKDLLSNFENNALKIKENYNGLRRTLKDNKLLALNVEKFKPTDALESLIETQSITLASSLDIVNYKDLLLMSDYNKLIAAKVLLSIYRRILYLQEFFLEGRVSLNNKHS